MFLKNITLVTIDGVDPEKGLKSLLHCMKEIKFGKVKLITYREPLNYKYFSKYIDLIIINKLNYNEYNWFKLHKLFSYVNTEFCLIIEPDGLVINPHLWREEFQSYDYIGAPWPKNEINNWPYLNQFNRVGNGGFCLRSRKLLEVSKKIPYSDNLDVGEDVMICRKNRDLFDKKNCIFAPVNVAIKFSIELVVDDYPTMPDSFGFHRYYNYEKLLEQINLTKPLEVQIFK